MFCQLGYERHSLSKEQFIAFQARHRTQRPDVVQQIQQRANKNAKDNQEVLKAISDVVITLGKQGLAFRGHRDDRRFHEDEANNPGNFVAITKLHSRANETLQKHLASHAKNASYISKTIQNELIEICGEIIREEILKEVKDAKWFAVMADETRDISNEEQLAIVLRYVYKGMLS